MAVHTTELRVLMQSYARPDGIGYHFIDDVYVCSRNSQSNGVYR